MTKKLPKIIIDSREKTPFKFSDKVTTEVRKLDTGDYSLEGYETRLCIERKSIPDLISSLSQSRFVNELERMASFETAMIVVEGSLQETLVKKGCFKKRLYNPAIKKYIYTELGPSRNVIEGKILSILTQRNIQVVFVDTAKPSQFVEHLCVYLWGKYEKERKGIPQSSTLKL